MPFSLKVFMMTVQRRGLRFRLRILFLSTIILFITIWTLLAYRPVSVRGVDESELRHRFPFTYKYVHTFKKGLGGGNVDLPPALRIIKILTLQSRYYQTDDTNKQFSAWYIPPEWIDTNQPLPNSIIEAAQLASKATQSYPERHIPFSNIPLLIHQKWDSTQLNGTKEMILSYIEEWLIDSISPPTGSSPMAYFLWDNEGILALMKEYENNLTSDFIEVFSPVEKVDIFRITACKWFGGIYGDIDTKPLKHPSHWIRSADISEWTDKNTGKSYGLDETTLTLLHQNSQQPQPVNAIWGIECDTDPETDAHWRMAYTYPIQLTNWAFASAPRHPILQYFLDRLPEKAAEARDRVLHNPGSSLSQLHYDPVIRTGPVAVTEATNWRLEEHEGLRWNALTGLEDGGKTKLVGDVLILPITGFSPTQEKSSRMGEKSWEHPDARLAHKAMGSWHHTNLIVEYGKFCRAFLGLCKDWQGMW